MAREQPDSHSETPWRGRLQSQSQQSSDGLMARTRERNIRTAVDVILAQRRRAGILYLSEYSRTPAMELRRIPVDEGHRDQLIEAFSKTDLYSVHYQGIPRAREPGFSDRGEVQLVVQRPADLEEFNSQLLLGTLLDETTPLRMNRAYFSILSELIGVGLSGRHFAAWEFFLRSLRDRPGWTVQRLWQVMQGEGMDPALPPTLLESELRRELLLGDDAVRLGRDHPGPLTGNQPGSRSQEAGIISAESRASRSLREVFQVSLPVEYRIGRRVRRAPPHYWTLPLQFESLDRDLIVLREVPASPRGIRLRPAEAQVVSSNPVTVSERFLFLPQLQGSQLTHLSLWDPTTRRAYVQGRDYRLVRDPGTQALAVEFLPSGPNQETLLRGRRVSWDARFQVPPRVAHADEHAPILLRSALVRPIVDQMEQAGMRTLAERLRTSLDSSPDRISLQQLQSIFSTEAYYTHREMGVRGQGAANAENPFSEFQRFMEQENLFLQCSGARALFYRFLNLYLSSPGLAPSERFQVHLWSGYLQGNFGRQMTQDDFHAALLVTPPGETEPLIVDPTPWRHDPRSPRPPGPARAYLTRRMLQVRLALENLALQGVPYLVETPGLVASFGHPLLRMAEGLSVRDYLPPPVTSLEDQARIQQESRLQRLESTHSQLQNEITALGVPRSRFPPWDPAHAALSLSRAEERLRRGELNPEQVWEQILHQEPFRWGDLQVPASITADWILERIRFQAQIQRRRLDGILADIARWRQNQSRFHPTQRQENLPWERLPYYQDGVFVDALRWQLDLLEELVPHSSTDVIGAPQLVPQSGADCLRSTAHSLLERLAPRP